MLSDFRGNIKIPLVCKMALAQDPAVYFTQVEKVYSLLNKGKLAGSSYRAMAAMMIAEHLDKKEAAFYVERTCKIYGKMKEAHRWLTSDEDMPFAAMLAVSDVDADVLLAEAERCNDLCKDTFGNQNARQSLSHVLALSNVSAEQKCQKASAIWRGMKEAKHKYGTGSEISLLGSLAGLALSAEEIVNEMLEADDYLKQQKGFGDFSMGASVRRMIAGLMVMNTHQPKDTAACDSAVQSSLMMVIQMEICMLVMVSTMAATSAATSSN